MDSCFSSRLEPQSLFTRLIHTLRPSSHSVDLFSVSSRRPFMRTESLVPRVEQWSRRQKGRENRRTNPTTDDHSVLDSLPCIISLNTQTTTPVSSQSLLDCKGRYVCSQSACDTTTTTPVQSTTREAGVNRLPRFSDAGRWLFSLPGVQSIPVSRFPGIGVHERGKGDAQRHEAPGDPSPATDHQ